MRLLRLLSETLTFTFLLGMIYLWAAFGPMFGLQTGV